MIEHKKRTTASVIFSHLSREERIDKACELLAVGVLRLAEKRGLLRNKIKENKGANSKERNDGDSALHKNEPSKKKSEVVCAN